MDVKIESLQFRTIDFYNEFDIEVLTGVSVESIDTNRNSLRLTNGDQVNYDCAFLATGLRGRKADVPGFDLKNVLVLRDYDDAVLASSLFAEDKELVVLGSSFIGMEAASYCVSKVIA